MSIWGLIIFCSQPDVWYPVDRAVYLAVRLKILYEANSSATEVKDKGSSEKKKKIIEKKSVSESV